MVRLIIELYYGILLASIANATLIEVYDGPRMQRHTSSLISVCENICFLFELKHEKILTLQRVESYLAFE